ncbi:MAG TPA: tripartite tricarboxylate transporter substrate binding protein [Xanthobacteraceae bacterium]|jgi:tripartite-type tricarboxylate transporter receptor subunit TctC|nr:tripartite tricarboxylate transporter substrate binding protein [Xanthobacteraceae bacterium]
MKLARRKFLRLASGAIAAGSYPGSAFALDYPTRPITIVVPFAAGGATDVLARVLSDPMSKSLGQTLIVENLTGAAGSIGVTRVVRAPADGYTLSIGTLTTHVLIGGLYKLDFDLLGDLTPIAELAYEPLLICVKNSLPVHNLKELIAWLRANPGKASVGIPGAGSTGNLAGISFQNVTGTTFQFVPYRGDAPAVQDMMAGQIDMMIEPSSNFTAQVLAGTIRAIAVPSKTRLANLPDVPTTDEAGLPGYYASIWFGMWAPKNTPKDVIVKLNAAAVAALADEGVKARLNKLGQQVAPRDLQEPAAFAAFQKSEAEKWWPIIKAANIKVE